MRRAWLGIGLALAPLVVAQKAAARPKFEVAPVRPCRPGDPASSGGGRGGDRSVTTSPGRLNVACMTVAELIDQYTGRQYTGRQYTGRQYTGRQYTGRQYTGRQSTGMFGEGDSPDNSGGTPDTHPIRGGPAWAVPGKLTAADRLMIGPMPHALPEDRFQLRTHRKSEVVPMYALTIAKGGPKIEPVKGGDCIAEDPAKNIWDHVNEKPVCGNTYSGLHGPNLPWDPGERPISNFEEFALSNLHDRYVIDKTGLAGLYGFHLEFAPGESTPGSMPVVPGSDIPPGPLEPVKGPRGFIITDQAEGPSEN